MDIQELKEKFRTLYKDMAESKDVDKMIIFGDAFKKMYDKVAEMHPDMAAATLGILGAIEYNNYMTPEEAMDAATKLVNDDGSPAPHWRMDEAKAFLTSRDIPTEEKPYYNFPALWLTMNMLYSDFAEPVTEMLGSDDNEKVATAFYKMAIKRLKDVDRPKFIRWYFREKSAS